MPNSDTNLGDISGGVLKVFMKEHWDDYMHQERSLETNNCVGISSISGTDSKSGE